MPRSRGRTGRPWRRLRLAILANSNTCTLCHQPIDHTIPYPHPMSPTVHHLTPLAHGGPELDPANCAAAHKICNERQGARPTTTVRSREW